MRSHIRPGKAIYKDSPVANCTGRNYAAVREVQEVSHNSRPASDTFKSEYNLREIVQNLLS